MESHKIVALLNHAYSFPEGRSRTALMEEAVRGADLLNDLDWQFNTRIEFIHAAARSDDMPKMMAAVGWCQGVFDQHPDRFDADAMIGAISSAVNCVGSIYQLTREQCDEMFADYKRRLQQLGYNLHSYHQKRAYTALWMGDRDIAREHFQRMLRCEVEHGPWERLFCSDYYLQTGQTKEAMQEVAPILKARDDADGTYHWAASFQLVPLALSGKKWKASRCQKRAYQLLKSNPDHIELVGHHLLYLAVVRKYAHGAQMLQDHLQWALEAFPHRELFEFYVGAWRLCRDAETRHKRLPLQLPREFPVDKASECADLTQWLHQQAVDLAGRFDDRNGNQHFHQVLQQRGEVGA